MGRTSGVAAVAALGDFGRLLPLSPVKAEDLQVTPEIVQFTPDIEPVVQLIEATPREKCFEMMLGQLHAGLPYRRFVAAVFLAGIRNVRPHPLGFKFHCVLAIHAAHQLSLDVPVNQRLLPMFWMLDDFKESQERDVAEGDFRMPPVKGPLPAPEKAWNEFHAAMETWDEPRADRAITALTRSRGALEVIEGLWRYGARDFRNIGHKSIYVVGAWRVLKTIGWRHAEPILRSVAMGMTDYGPNHRLNNYAFEDQCFLANQERVTIADGLPGDWTAGQENLAVTRELLDVMRGGDFVAASAKAIDLLSRSKTGATSLWDAVHLMSAELMIRQPGIYGIHTVTSVNALRNAYRESSNSQTRLLMLLQSIGWMCQFRNFMSEVNGGLQEAKITSLTPADVSSNAHDALEDIFAEVGANPQTAAAKTLAFAGQHDSTQFAAFARQLILLKNREVHGLKFPVAIFEDHKLVSPSWRPHMLATATYYLPGTSQPDSPVMQKARETVCGL
jgi:hypothetical protein